MKKAFTAALIFMAVACSSSKQSTYVPHYRAITWIDLGDTTIIPPDTSKVPLTSLQWDALEPDIRSGQGWGYPTALPPSYPQSPFNQLGDSAGVYELVVRLARQVQELQARIKVLEGRPVLSIRPSESDQNRAVWLDGEGYSIIIKRFNYKP